MVAVVQTFGERVNFHPHVHAIVSRGGWRKDGTWIPVAYADPAEAEKVFRHHVLSFLRKRGLIDEERVRLLLSWRHTGFSVHNSVVVEPEDPPAVERLIRYMMRPPVALDRLEYDEAAGVIEIRSRPGSDDEPDGEARERVDADELVARVIAQVPGSQASPDPRVWVVRETPRAQSGNGMVIATHRTQIQPPSRGRQAWRLSIAAAETLPATRNVAPHAGAGPI